MAATSTTAWRSTMPRSRPRSASNRRGPGTTPTTPAVDAVERIVRDEADRLRLRAPRQAQARDAAGTAGRAGAQRRAAGRATAWTPTSRSSTRPACGPRSPAIASSAGCSTSAAARCTWAASRMAWRRRPSAAARRSTPAPACSGSSALGQRPGAPRAHRARHAARAAGAAGQRRGAAWRLRQLRLAAPAHRADRQLHRRHRAAGRRARECAAARAPHLRDGRQHPPLLPPDARPPPGVRRARALRASAARVSDASERRDPARRHGRDLSVAGRRRASTTAGAAWST